MGRGGLSPRISGVVMKYDTGADKTVKFKDESIKHKNEMMG
jgi:hypothetical protein